MKTKVQRVDNKGDKYDCLMFVCPGCIEFGYSGIHMLAITENKHGPSWGWNGDTEKPTLTPSILTRYDTPDGSNRCHSFLRDGIFQFLGDCTHSLAGKNVPIPDLPGWADEE